MPSRRCLEEAVTSGVEGQRGTICQSAAAER
jgi:hypothetical protein